MPVWHAAVRELRERGDLHVVGIVQEQHPDRARLYAQWQGLDWPILWDASNLTGATGVPSATVVDAAGIVRGTGRFDLALVRSVVGAWRASGAPIEGDRVDARDAVRAIPGWTGELDLGFLVRALEAEAAAHPSDAALQFRLGVVHRRRYDSVHARPGDFQAALDAWTRALALEPGQYVWRRRIQQYGPRLDKPYPFYDWIERARDELRARGETPVELRAEPTGAERAAPAAELEAIPAQEPDPGGTLPRDGGEWLVVESAVAFDTRRDRRVARVHLDLAPNPRRRVHWNNEVEPLRVWLEGADGLPGLELERRLLVCPQPRAATSDETRRIDFEVRFPPGFRGEATLTGYALFHACEDAGGTCTFLRRDLAIPLRAPADAR